MTTKITNRICSSVCTYLMVVLAAGCATNSTNSEGEWQQPRVRKAPYKSVLVVTAIPDPSVRLAFDQTLVAQINKAGAKAINGNDLRRQMDMPKLDRDAVIAMAKETGAEAIIVSTVLDKSGQFAEHRGDVVVKYNPGFRITQYQDPSMTSVMASSYWIEVTQATAVIDGDAVVGTYLYELATGDKLIYGMTTSGNFRVGPHRFAEGIGQEFALKIAKQLRSDGVIR